MPTHCTVEEARAAAARQCSGGTPAEEELKAYAAMFDLVADCQRMVARSMSSQHSLALPAEAQQHLTAAAESIKEAQRVIERARVARQG